MNYCFAKNCRFPTFHTTNSHKCGLCYQYGHGAYECTLNPNNNGDNTKLMQIWYFTNSYDYKIPNHLQCTIDKCKFKHHHMTESHT